MTFSSFCVHIGIKVGTTASRICGAWDRTRALRELCPLSHVSFQKTFQNRSLARGFLKARLHSDLRPRLDICPSLLPVTAGAQGCHCPGVFHGTTGWYGLLSAHFISPGEQLKDSGRNSMLARAYGEAHTPAQWSTCWASRGCGAGAPGHRQSVRFICMLDACHVPGLWADLTRHVIALKICKSGESCRL